MDPIFFAARVGSKAGMGLVGLAVVQHSTCNHTQPTGKVIGSPTVSCSGSGVLAQLFLEYGVLIVVVRCIGRFGEVIPVK